MEKLSESRRKEIEERAATAALTNINIDPIFQMPYALGHKEGATYWASLLEEKERECEGLEVRKQPWILGEEINHNLHSQIEAKDAQIKQLTDLIALKDEYAEWVQE